MTKRLGLTLLSIALMAGWAKGQGNNFGLAYATGASAPTSCNSPAIFFPNNGSAPAYCNGNPGTFTTFGTSSGAAITGSPTSGQLAKFSAANSLTNGDLTGDCTTGGALALTCTKTSGTLFSPSATTDTTNAANISSGTLAIARLPIVPILNGGTGSSNATTAVNNLLGSTTTNFVLTYNGTNWVGAAAPGAGSLAVGSPTPSATEVAAWTSPSSVVGYTGLVTDTAGNLTSNSLTTNGAIPLSGAPNALGGISFPIPASNPTSTTCAASTNYLLGGTNALYFCQAGGSAPSLLGSAVPINVQSAAPASSTFNQGCTLTFTNGSNVVTASAVNCFTSSNVGDIIEYNKTGSAANCNAAVVALTPCFRGVITAISGVNVTLGAGGYYPDTTTSGVAFAAGPTAGTWQLLSGDICAQTNAILAVYGATTADAGMIGGSPNCSFNMWNGLDYTTSFGLVRWGAANVNLTAQQFLPQQSSFTGLGKGQNGNTFIQAVTGANGFSQTFEANGVASANFTATAAGTTFSDQPAGGTCGTLSATNACSTIVQVVNTAACITGKFGQFKMLNPLTGFKESSQISFQNVTNWNGTYALVAVSGLNGVVEFPASCSAPTVVNSSCTTTCSDANLAVNNDVLADWPVTVTGHTLTGGPGTWVSMADSAADFAASAGDVGVAQITCLTNCNGNTGPYNVVDSADTSHAVMLTATSLNWAAATFSMTRWISSEISALSSFNSSSQVATFTVIGPNLATAAGTVTYYLAGPMFNFANFSSGGGNSIQASDWRYFNSNCNSIIGCGVMSADAAQEQGVLDHLGLSGWTTYGIRCMFNCAHSGPWSTIQGSAANTSPPTAAGLIYDEAPAGQAPRGITSMTWTANVNGADPIDCFRVNGNAVLFSDNHCERFGANFDVGTRGNSTTSSQKGLTFVSNDTGIGNYYGYWFHSNAKVNATVTAGWNTNTPGKAYIRDDNFAQTGCGAGTTLITDNGAASPGTALYSINTSTASNTRFVSDPGATNCLGSFGYSVNCSGGGAGGSATPTCNGSTGTINVPTTTTSVTVSDTSVTANSTILITQVTNNTRTGATSCSGTAATPLISAQSAGTSFTFTMTSVAAETCFEFQVLN